jgi:hypothetical protein
MKLWGSMRQQASKVAFEAEKAVRIKREESAIAGIRSQIDAKARELGKVVLALCEEGEISHPQVMPIYQEVQQLQEQIQELEIKVAGIRAEEYSEKEVPAAEAEAAPPPPPPPPATENAYAPLQPPPASEVGSAAPQPPPAEEPSAQHCPNCGATVGAGKFCPECGQPLNQE